MKKREGKIRDINSGQERERRQESEFAFHFRSDFIKEGNKIAEELESDEKLDDVPDDAPELLGKIIGQLREEGKWDDEAYRKEAGEEVYNLLPEADQLALRRGRKLAKIEQRWKKKRKVIMHHVAGFAIVCGVLTASFGVKANREYMIQILRGFNNKGQKVFIDKTDDEALRGREENDRQKIREETGIDVPSFVYKPEEWVYEESIIDSNMRNAKIIYINEKGYHFFVYMTKESASEQEMLDINGEVLKQYEVFDRYLGLNIPVQELKGTDSEDYYQAEFSYNDTYYLLMGKMEKEEFDQIIKKMMF